MKICYSHLHSVSTWHDKHIKLWLFAECVCLHLESWTVNYVQILTVDEVYSTLYHK